MRFLLVGVAIGLLTVACGEASQVRPMLFGAHQATVVAQPAADQSEAAVPAQPATEQAQAPLQQAQAGQPAAPPGGASSEPRVNAQPVPGCGGGHGVPPILCPPP